MPLLNRTRRTHHVLHRRTKDDMQPLLVQPLQHPIAVAHPSTPALHPARRRQLGQRITHRPLLRPRPLHQRRLMRPRPTRTRPRRPSHQRKDRPNPSRNMRQRRVLKDPSRRQLLLETLHNSTMHPRSDATGNILPVRPATYCRCKEPLHRLAAAQGPTCPAFHGKPNTPPKTGGEPPEDPPSRLTRRQLRIPKRRKWGSRTKSPRPPGVCMEGSGVAGVAGVARHSMATTDHAPKRPGHVPCASLTTPSTLPPASG